MEQTFLSVYTEAAPGGIPLAFVVIGLVAWFKMMGAQGKVLTGLGMAFGILFGSAYMYAQTYQQFTAGMGGAIVGPILAIVVYGVGLGITATGSYKAGEGLLLKSKEK